jgi:MFS family permease
MTWSNWVGLSFMQFLEFAIWGAWFPVLAPRLFGPLKMSGKQVGWIYGTMYLGFIIAPMFGGQITDRWVSTEWFLGGAHLIGGILLLLAARQKSFGSLFIVMLLYAMAFAPTVSSANSLMFAHMKGFEAQSFGVMVWGVVGWVIVGWLLSIWRGVKGAGEGSDCLVFAGLLSIVMAVYCVACLPHTPPSGQAGEMMPFLGALDMLKQPAFLIFLIVAFVLATQLMFYFQGTAQYLGDLGIQSKNIPAVMTIAQVFEALTATGMHFYGKGIIEKVGFHWLFVAGAGSWFLLYCTYSLMRPKALVIASQALHGIAYTLFVRQGFLFVNSAAPENIRGSAQALFIVVMFGLGFFVGSQYTGAIMDKFKTPEGNFRWRTLYMVPLALTALCVLVLAALFRP